MRVDQPDPQDLIDSIMTPSRIEKALHESGCFLDGNENIKANNFYHVTYEWHPKNTTSCEEYVVNMPCPDFGIINTYPPQTYKCWENSPEGGKYVKGSRCIIDKGPPPKNETICQVRCNKDCIGYNINYPCTVTYIYEQHLSRQNFNIV